MRAAHAQQDDRRDPQEEEPAVHRAEAAAAHRRGVQPGQHEQHQDRAEHHAHAAELVRDRAQDGVERQEVPFGHDVGRRLQRVGRDEVVRVAQEVRCEEHQRGEHQQEHADADAVLDRVVRVERHRVLRPLHVDAQRVVGPHHVQCGDVQEHHADDDEGQQVVQREEPVQRRVIDAEPAPQPGDDAMPDDREGGEQVGDDGGAPVGHLAPGQHVAHERRGHHQQQDDDADHPQQFAGRLVGTVVQPAEDVDVGDDEEHRCTVLVHIADQPAVVHIAHDVLHAVERELRVRLVVHRQEDAGGDHDHQVDHGQRAEVPEVVEILRRGEDAILLLEHGEDGQSAVDPVDHRIAEAAVVNLAGHRAGDLSWLSWNGLSRS